MRSLAWHLGVPLVLLVALPAVAWDPWRYEPAYLDALRNSQATMPIYNQLTTIDASDPSRTVRMTVFTDFYYDRTYTPSGWRPDLWATHDSELWDWHQANGTAAEDMALRTKQLLGLPSNYPNDMIVEFEFEVEVHSLFRPTRDPLALDNPVSPTTFADYMTPGSPYRTWFDGCMATYDPADRPTQQKDPCPWTTMGYTYDWGNPDSVVGLTEFIIQENDAGTGKNNPVHVVAVVPVMAYKYYDRQGNFNVQVNATGNVILEAGSTIEVRLSAGPGPAITDGDRFSILTSKGTITDGGPTLVSTSAFLEFTGQVLPPVQSWDPTTYNLNVHRTASFASVAQTANGRHMAAALDQDLATAAGTYGGLINELSFLSAASFNGTLKQLSPGAYHAVETSANRTAQYLAESMDQYLRARRLGMASGWAHEYLGDEALDVRFVGGQTRFDVEHGGLFRDAGYVGSSLTLLPNDYLSLLLRYEGELSSGGDFHAVDAGLMLQY